MLEAGTAYRCFATKEEIDAAREAARAEGRPPLFNSPWRDKGPEDWPTDTPYTVRLKAPRVPVMSGLCYVGTVPASNWWNRGPRSKSVSHAPAP